MKGQAKGQVTTEPSPKISIHWFFVVNVGYWTLLKGALMVFEAIVQIKHDPGNAALIFSCICKHSDFRFTFPVPIDSGGKKKFNGHYSEIWTEGLFVLLLRIS